MSGVYSKRFLASPSTTVQVSALVPAGKVWVLKQLDALSGPIPAGGAAAAINVAGVAFFYHVIPVGGDPRLTWSGMQVANPGETVAFAIGAGSWGFMLSGYELSVA
jgi:hypothetical protein